mmetsp:Transcript_22173/g.68575  ORF Transcript_22173/g.68575 Transcript_22173/m.68575 type:complete len:339 (+) Transcript_22173:327-1343(+)
MNAFPTQLADAFGQRVIGRHHDRRRAQAEFLCAAIHCGLDGVVAVPLQALWFDVEQIVPVDEKLRHRQRQSWYVANLEAAQVALGKRSDQHLCVLVDYGRRRNAHRRMHFCEAVDRRSARRECPRALVWLRLVVWVSNPVAEQPELGDGLAGLGHLADVVVQVAHDVALRDDILDLPRRVEDRHAVRGGSIGPRRVAQHALAHKHVQRHRRRLGLIQQVAIRANGAEALAHGLDPECLGHLLHSRHAIEDLREGQDEPRGLVLGLGRALLADQFAHNGPHEVAHREEAHVAVGRPLGARLSARALLGRHVAAPIGGALGGRGRVGVAVVHERHGEHSL